METADVGGPRVVGLSLEGPREVRRATVAFRIILAIPHFLLLSVFSLVGMIAMVFAWFGALVVGRMPEGLGDFLAGILQYSTRVYGYVYLMTDEYPPFALEERDYPITVLLPPRGRLNRAAVLFRLVLGVPVFILVSLVTSGLQVALFVIWLVVLIAGRMPTSVFEAESVFLRYQARVYAWSLMLTPEYPRGLFGDGATPVGAAPDAPGAPGADLSEFLVGSTLPPPPPPPTAGTPRLFADPVSTSGAPRITRLVLSKAGKRLMVVFIVVGSLLTAGQIAVLVAVSGQSSEAARHLDHEYRVIGQASQRYGASIQACGLSGVAGGPDCVHDADREFAQSVRRFRSELDDQKLPGHALATADDLRDDLTRLIDILDRMTTTSDVDAYRDLVGQFQTLAKQVDTGYADLHDELVFGGY